MYMIVLSMRWIVSEENIKIYMHFCYAVVISYFLNLLREQVFMQKNFLYAIGNFLITILG